MTSLSLSSVAEQVAAVGASAGAASLAFLQRSTAGTRAGAERLLRELERSLQSRGGLAPSTAHSVAISVALALAGGAALASVREATAQKRAARPARGGLLHSRLSHPLVRALAGRPPQRRGAWHARLW